MNETIIKHFLDLSTLYADSDDSRRSATFLKVSERIQEFEKDITLENLDEVLDLPGIGKSSISEITEVLETGTSVRLSKLQENLPQIDKDPELDGLINLLS